MYRYLLILLILPVFLFSGCEKDNDNNLGNKSFRLRAWADTIKDYYRCDIFYKDERVKEIEVRYGRNNELWTRNEWSYEKNKITIRAYSKSHKTGIWYEEDGYLVKIFDDKNKLSESHEYSEGSLKVTKYHWKGDLLISQEINIDFGLDYQYLYTYEGDLLKVINVTGIPGIPDYYYNLDYISGKVDKITEYRFDTINSTSKFTYQGDQLFDCTFSQRDFSDVKETFFFDSNNNLSMKIKYEEDFLSNIYETKTFYAYESGKGNLYLYWLVKKGWLSVYLYPNMVPAGTHLEPFHL